MNDIIINKVQSIQRCIQRAREEYSQAGSGFAADYSRQDAAILNITRACEQAIDLANHVIKRYKIGIPNSSSDAFMLLARQQCINETLATRMKAMVGFRNIAVHQYQQLDIAILTTIITVDLDELVAFTQAIVSYVRENP